MLDLGSLDLEEIGNALADQTDYEHRWLIDPQTGEIVFWTANTGIDGKAPVDLDELDCRAHKLRGVLGLLGSVSRECEAENAHTARVTKRPIKIRNQKRTKRK
jgi:hypothetical protein